ncbi:MAG TPA: hypothetical protein VL625_12215 [Patescibacteria group bacterium]|nr:hypothetical protein [Patescibacteria group bacterium]
MENSLTTIDSLKTNFSKASENSMNWEKWLEVAKIVLPVLLVLAEKLLPLLLASPDKEKANEPAAPTLAPALAVA